MAMRNKQLLVAIIVLALVCQATLAFAADPPPTIKVGLKRAEDTVIVSATDAGATISVTSATGIGAANIVRRDKTWPKELRLVLNIRGLEGLSLTQGDRKLQTFLGSDAPTIAHRNADGKWEEAKFDKAFAPILVKNAATITITIPAAWLDPAQAELQVEWIDFYRG
ncbi:MAG TPA: hypothetical protein VL096_17095 [Pirellulaceae bacterium]|nr:hypothetical protein [Pirellulaceae bacterium]